VPGTGAGAFIGSGVFECARRHIGGWDAAQGVGCGVEPLPDPVAGVLLEEHSDHPCEPRGQPSRDRRRRVQPAAPDTACAGDGVRPVPSARAGGDVAVPHRHRIGGVNLVRPPLPPDDDHHEHREPQRQEHSGSGHGEDPDQQERADHYSARHCARATKRQPLGRIRGALSPRPDTTRAGNPLALRQRRAGYRAGPRRLHSTYQVLPSRLVGDIAAAFSAAKRSLCGRFACQNVRGP
jgi:hypothetical protein